MLNNNERTGHAAVFTALGDKTRLELISRLSDGEMHSIMQLSQGLTLTRQGVTKHLNVLQDVGIVSSTKIGRETMFAIEPNPILKARDYLCRAATQWDETIDRIKAIVEE